MEHSDMEIRNETSTHETEEHSDSKTKKKRKHSKPKSQLNEELESSDTQMSDSKHRVKVKKHRNKSSVISSVLEELEDDVVVEHLKGGADYYYNVPNIDSIAQPCAPCDKVYVQQRNGFAVVPKAKALMSVHSSVKESVNLDTSFVALDIALLVQKIFGTLYNLCHGLLAGLSLGQCILIWTVCIPISPVQIMDFIHTYFYMARAIQITFFILSVLCVLSLFDKIDLAHMDCRHLQDIIQFHPVALLITSVYCATLIISLVTTYWDDRLSLQPYDGSLWIEPEVIDEELNIWKVLNLLRCLLAILGLFLISIFNTEDMLYIHLQKMQKFKFMPLPELTQRY